MAGAPRESSEQIRYSFGSPIVSNGLSMGWDSNKLGPIAVNQKQRRLIAGALHRSIKSSSGRHWLTVYFLDQIALL